MTLTLYGVPQSPFVRKARIALEEKGLPYQLESPAPGQHPMGKMPVLRDGDLVVPDSSVICAYLEKTHPSPRLYPDDPADTARALFLEEYADTAMTEGMGPIVFERIVKPSFLGQPTDTAALEKLLAVASERWMGKPVTVTGQAIPAVLDWLETQLPADRDTVLPRFGIADVAVGCHLGWLALAGFEIDERRFPRVARYQRAVEARPSFKATRP
jgi:glutathione S-transferase